VADNDAVVVLEQMVGTAARARVPVVVHSCAADVPVGMLVRAGVAGVSLDLTLVREELDDALGEAIESGVVLLAGVVPAAGGELSDAATTVGPVRRLADARRRLALTRLESRTRTTQTRPRRQEWRGARRPRAGQRQT
jgi:hypothetical protein